MGAFTWSRVEWEYRVCQDTFAMGCSCNVSNPKGKMKKILQTYLENQERMSYYDIEQIRNHRKISFLRTKHQLILLLPTVKMRCVICWIAWHGHLQHPIMRIGYIPPQYHALVPFKCYPIMVETMEHFSSGKAQKRPTALCSACVVIKPFFISRLRSVAFTTF